jgi:EAL domain-containing protein (putative c-di-GMP-specific phosphodiesterase class I)
MHESALKILAFEEELPLAISNGEIHVYYQPIVHASSNEIYAFEALVRWLHPTRGMISPLDFIPLAEETGLILPLGDYIFETACQQIALWQKVTRKIIKVGINLSALQFSQPGIAANMIDTIHKYGINPGCLDIEVTESMAMEDVEQTISILQDLRKTGAQISIDDFGTGYSSLAYLKRFPIHTLKIDRCFIIDITRNFDDQAIVKAIIAMAEELQLKILVEGVETQEQVEILKLFGCHYFQGFYFAKPMNAEHATQLLMTLEQTDTPTTLPL